jgi:hypothetical protein
MFNVPVNFVSLLLAAAAALGFGALWYSPVLFGLRWANLTGVDEEMAKGSTASYAIYFLALLLQAYITAIVLFYFESTSVLDGLWVGFLIWLGFLATGSVGIILWERKPAGLYVINNGYMLLSSLIISVIIAGRM